MVLTGVKRLLKAQFQLRKDKDGQVGVTKDSKLRYLDTDDGSSILQYAGTDADLMAAMIFRTESRARKLLGEGFYPACIYDALRYEPRR